MRDQTKPAYQCLSCQINPRRRSNTMWIVDTELKAREEQNRPIRVGIVGAGFMGQGLTNQIVHSVPGMRVVAISNRQVERAVSVFKYAGRDGVLGANSQRAFVPTALSLQP